MTIRRRHVLVGLSFVSPWIIGFLWFFAVPFVRTVMLSFGTITNYGTFSVTFAGWEHFYRAFYVDGQFIPMFLNVVRDALINIPLIIFFSFYFSVILNRKMKGRGLFRMLCFLPVILGTGFVMEQLLGNNVSSESIKIAEEFLLPPDMLAYIGPKAAGYVTFFLERLNLILWHCGVQILIFLSGLQEVPASLYEAAKVDSATEWESLWFITMPMMAPLVLLNLVYTMVDSFTDASNPIIQYILDYGFEFNQFEYASAIGLIYLLFVLAFIGIVFLLFRKRVRL